MWRQVHIAGVTVAFTWCLSTGTIRLTAADCNSNGLEDQLDILAGTSSDCNTTGIPDECEVRVASSQDCDTNGIPDECQPDCNTNGVADRCDLALGSSTDANLNLIPDECEGQLVAASTEFSVYNTAFDCTNDATAWSREFSVYNDEVMLNNGWSREFSVYLPPLVLDIGTLPPGAGTTEPDMCTADYTSGDMIPIIAVATNGFDFDFWSAVAGALLDDPQSACTIVTVDDNTSVTANFVASATVTLIWTGGGDRVSWNDPSNWCPPLVPDEVDDRSLHAIIDGFTFAVELDTSPTLTRLDILNGAQLVVATNGLRSLTVSDYIVNTGIIHMDGGGTLDIDADIDQTPDGSVQIAGGSLVRFINGTITGGFIEIEPGSGSLFNLVCTATLNNVGLRDLVIPDTVVVDMAGTAINVGSIFVDAFANSTGIEALADLTLRPPTGQQADLILGDQDFAFVGNASRSLTNSADHRIVGAGTVRATMLDNAGTIEAGPTALGGMSAETLAVDSPVDNDGTLQAQQGFTLRLNGDVDQTTNGVIEARSGGVVEVTHNVTGSGAMISLLPCGGGLELGCTPPLLVIGANVVAQAGALQALDTGIVQLGDLSQTDVSGLAKVSGGRLTGTMSSTASLTANTMELSSSAAGRGEILLFDQMTAQLTGTVSILPCGGLILGCTPPLLAVENDALLVIGGDLQIQTNLDLSVTSGQSVHLAGDLDNAAANPLTFDWTMGALTLDGGDPQLIEAAGTDLGPGLAGLQNNFAIAALEIEAGTDVTLVNARFNTVGTNGCDEALYVRNLILRTGSALHLDNTRLYYVTLTDEGAVVDTIDCGELAHNATGDADNNGTLDQADYEAFAECMDGNSMDCQVFDFDTNNQIDLADFANLQQRYGQ